MRIVICEDEDKYAEQLIDYINEWAETRNISVEIFTYVAAEKFLYDWSDNEDYDLLFLDIKMGSMTGMELAKIIRRTNRDIPIIFATNMKEYAIEGYDVGAMQFLLKPVRKENCFACLDRVYQSDRIKRYFLFKDLENDRTIRIPHSDIIYIEKFAHNANIVTTEGEYSIRKTTAQLTGELNDDLFVKCHKSYIISIRHMKSLSNALALMSDGSKIPLSKNMVKEINEKFYNYNVRKVQPGGK
jgi:DNA-binding LytR/AlgR family response regulator